ncbi:winged helix-turn-helix domain-containing protein [Aliidiomarina halalkaliphila]|uniref:winged helix-turn-helix domain-containing protein n=1 Tax=Aliidiomarina halalkaliphila TaxID=2593535 RepID=UPI00163DCA1F|nr:winged helix-turn-helix domain-containing protein [Aliidiomarina halalkaliphila]
MKDSQPWLANIAYRFNGWTFIPATAVLLSPQEKRIELEPRLAKLLQLFCEQPQSVFNKETLLQEVWAPRVVSEESITVAVSQLRKYLGQTSSEMFIKTIPGSGYCWLPVTERAELNRSSHSRTRWWWGTGIAVVAIVALLTVRLSDTTTDIEPPSALIADAQALLHDSPDDAMRLFRQVLAQGPDASAYLGLVQAKLFKIPVAQLKEHGQELASLLDRARDLDSELPHLHWISAQVYFYGFWDFTRAHEELTQAYTRETHTPEFLLSYAEMMLAMGETDRVAESIHELRRSYPEFYAIPAVAWLHLMMGDLDSARGEINRILESDAPTYGLHVSGQLIGLAADDDEMAWSHLYALMKLADLPDKSVYRYEMIFQDEGLAAVHGILKEELPSSRLGHYGPPLSLARHAIIAGDANSAMTYLDQALAEQQVEALWFAADPLYEKVADHQGYRGLMERFKALVRAP